MVNLRPSMYRLWIIFAQTATVCLAVLFVVATLKPEWLPARTIIQGEAPKVALVQQAAQPAARGTHRADSYNDAVVKAAPAVVNIFTTKEVRVSRNPMLNDPLFRRFFGDQLGEDMQKVTSLGSGRSEERRVGKECRL